MEDIDARLSDRQPRSLCSLWPDETDESGTLSREPGLTSHRDVPWIPPFYTGFSHTRPRPSLTCRSSRTLRTLTPSDPLRKICDFTRLYYTFTGEKWIVSLMVRIAIFYAKNGKLPLRYHCDVKCSRFYSDFKVVD